MAVSRFVDRKHSFRNFCVAALMMVTAAAVAADDTTATTPFDPRFVPHWEAHCRAPFGDWTLRFQSTSGDPTDDDMTISLQASGAAAVSVPLKKALFVAEKFDTKTPSQCDALSTVTLPSGNTVVFFRRDARPLPDRVCAILLRGRDDAVLDTKCDLGNGMVSLSAMPAMTSNAGAARIKLYRPGRSSAMGWVRVTELDGKLKVKWE